MITAHIRLISKGEEGKKKIELARQAKLEKEIKENSFQPTLVAKSPRQTSHVSSSPYYERFAQQLSESEEKKKLAKAREEAIQNRELTYTPVLSTNKNNKNRFSSPSSPEKSIYSPTVFDRLADVALEKRQKKEQQIKLQMEKEMTFHPKIDKKSKTMELQKPAECEKMPLHERFTKDAERRKSVLLEGQKTQEEKEISPCTFQPNLSQSTESLRDFAAQTGRTPSPMRRGSYMLPTQTSQARTTPTDSADKAATTRKLHHSVNGASSQLRRSSFLQPTKASQAKVDTSPAAHRSISRLSTTAPQEVAGHRTNITHTRKEKNSVSPQATKFHMSLQVSQTSPATTATPVTKDVVRKTNGTSDVKDNATNATATSEAEGSHVEKSVDSKNNGGFSLSMTIFDEIMAEHVDISSPNQESEEHIDDIMENDITDDKEPNSNASALSDGDDLLDNTYKDQSKEPNDLGNAVTDEDDSINNTSAGTDKKNEKSEVNKTKAVDNDSAERNEKDPVDNDNTVTDEKDSASAIMLESVDSFPVEISKTAELVSYD